MEQEHGKDSPHRALVSEHHEDWALIDGDRCQLVSAKHLDADQGAWTWSTLMGDGGIPHLYRNYRRLSQTPKCRMVTNNAIRSLPETRALRDLCQLDNEADASPRNPVSANDRAELNHTLARYLMVHYKDADLDEEEYRGRSNQVNQCKPTSDLLEASTRFLESLILETGVPGRRDIVHSGPSRFVAPVLTRLGHPPIHAEAVWEALTGYVEQSMEDQLPTEDAGLTRLIRSFDTPTLTPGEEATEKRTVTTGQALMVIHRALDKPGIYLTPALPFEHKVTVKMDAGGLEANAIQRAEDRMATWRKTCASEVDDSPGTHAQMQEFADELEDQVDDLHVHLRFEGVNQGEFGMRLWHSATRLPPESFPPLPFRLTRSLLIGALADASDQCRIWFTPHRFDAERILLASYRGTESPATGETQEDGS
ncbi:hypothetical protein HFP72_03920 [Nocardiopsis sp. ARC36]